jgi:hypothetical protein
MTTLMQTAPTATVAHSRAKRTVELRCPHHDCDCPGVGKLVAKLIDVPSDALGSGAILQVACPRKKSRLIKIRL